MKFLPVFFTLNLLLLLSFNTFAAPGRPATPVNVMMAKITEIFPTSWMSGAVVSNNDAQIAAQVDGRLIHVAQIGDRVSKGDVIAKIDDTLIALQVDELQASVQSGKSNYQFLQDEVVRKQALAKQNLSSKTDFEQTVNNRDMAKATLAAQQARLGQMRQRLAFTKILAPFDAVVTTRLSKLGEVVSNGTKVLQLVETANLEITAQVPLTVYQFVRPGSELDVKSPLGQTRATVRTVVPVANNRSHLMELRLTLAESQWPVGLDVRVAVPTGKTENLLVVHRDAIVLRRGGNAVFRINADNKSKRVPVELGIASGSLIAISGGVKEGDNIVIRGSERLQDGQQVAIKDNNDTLVSIQSKE